MGVHEQVRETTTETKTREGEGPPLLVSDRVAEELKKARAITFPLSEREREIVERLNGKSLAD